MTAYCDYAMNIVCASLIWRH